MTFVAIMYLKSGHSALMLKYDFFVISKSGLQVKEEPVSTKSSELSLFSFVKVMRNLSVTKY